MVKTGSYTSNSEEETIALGNRLAKELQPGDIVALRGDLGTGKTHLVKGMGEALGIDKNRIHSPTFSLIHEYGGEPPLYHFDCYRMESVREALEIGIEEYLYGSGICVVEWPELIESLLPDTCIWINVSTIGKNRRKFVITEL